MTGLFIMPFMGGLKRSPAKLVAIHKVVLILMKHQVEPIRSDVFCAGDVTRLTVAGQTSLRPGDIVFVTDKRVYTAIELLNVLNLFRVAYENVR